MMEEKMNKCKYCKAKEGNIHKSDCKIENKRGMPHLHRTYFCARCGKERPKTFMVSDREWENVVKYYYYKTDILFKKCYDYVKIKKQRDKK